MIRRLINGWTDRGHQVDMAPRNFVVTPSFPRIFFHWRLYWLLQWLLRLITRPHQQRTVVTDGINFALCFYFDYFSIFIFLFFIFIITNKCTMIITKVYMTTIYNLYSYMFRHFHVIVRDYYISVSLSYTNVPNCSSLNYF
jgi:hypothetical protein